MIVGFVGMMGSGKTLSLTRRVFNLYNQGYKVYTNMSFDFPHTKLSIEDLLGYTSNPDKFQDAVIVIDEIHIWIDSRRSISNRNVIIGYFLTQTRKKNVKLFWTSQQRHQVDKRLRSNSDVIVECKSVWYQDDLLVINNCHVMDGRVFQDVFRGNDYFGLYDTNQTIEAV